MKIWIIEGWIIEFLLYLVSYPLVRFCLFHWFFCVTFQVWRKTTQVSLLPYRLCGHTRTSVGLVSRGSGWRLLLPPTFGAVYGRGRFENPDRLWSLSRVYGLFEWIHWSVILCASFTANRWLCFRGVRLFACLLACPCSL